MEGAVERVRPKIMTVTATIAALLPIMWGGGAGISVTRRIAAPMIGGMISSTVLTLVVNPAVYALWREWQIERRRVVAASPAPPATATLPGGFGTAPQQAR